MKTKQVQSLKVGEHMATTNGMRKVIALERGEGTVKVVVQCAASPATPRAPLGESTIFLPVGAAVRYGNDGDGVTRAP